jgi:hypothetical protein
MVMIDNECCFEKAGFLRNRSAVPSNTLVSAAWLERFNFSYSFYA